MKNVGILYSTYSWPCSIIVRVGGVVTHKDPATYIHAVTFTLAQDYGFTRIMSSYYFEENTDRGPPYYEDGYYS